MKCLLCEHDSVEFVENYFSCSHCDLIFKNPKIHLSSDEEFGRYQYHQNDIEDSQYVNFLKKLIDPIEEKIQKSWTHLDFGSGKISVFHHLLKSKVSQSCYYDLYFYPDKNLLNDKYDLVTCSEVVEHFNNPKFSIDELINTVKPNGYLAIMTTFYHPSTDFNSWWYKNDPTHVVFYQMKTLDYISRKYHLKNFYNDQKSVVIFQKQEEV